VKPGPLWPYMLLFGFALMGGWDLVFDLARWCQRRVRLLPGSAQAVSAESTRRGAGTTEAYEALAREMEHIDRDHVRRAVEG
jgi:hypothetical protein